MLTKYVAKKDARKVFDRQILMSRIALVLWIILLVPLELIMYTLMQNIYRDFSMEMPFQVRYSIVIAGILLVIFTGILFSFSRKSGYARIDAITAKYKNGEMIDYWKLADKKYFLLVFASGLLLVLFYLITVTLPLNYLANQLP